MPESLVYALIVIAERAGLWRVEIIVNGEIRGASPFADRALAEMVAAEVRDAAVAQGGIDVPLDATWN